MFSNDGSRMLEYESGEVGYRRNDWVARPEHHSNGTNKKYAQRCEPFPLPNDAVIAVAQTC